ncbi:porin family protein [Aequorivita echinoideorum]|uniref:Outer membrane beta-barrel protein n=1 Tax=Aequorivita echinoideorum TaxID=1549647 RepID=A0ABS5S6D6_9FLAO|nr:porin family protein [Aequorivita echinoideorum]MBT0608777.1 outer membrane beta-barrel protein [Aequorivita echinoideorum]
MKKFILAALTVFMGSNVFAQEIDFGIKAGVNFASISDADDLSNRTGFQAGIFGGIKFTDNLGIQADLLYSQQGAEFDAGDFDLTYVNVPVVLKYYLVQGLNIQAGPQFGFIVDDNISTVVGDIEESIEAEKTDVSGIVGAGYDFPFGIRVDARYNFGLTKVVEGSDSKNSVVSIALGYSFL